MLNDIKQYAFVWPVKSTSWSSKCNHGNLFWLISSVSVSDSVFVHFLILDDIHKGLEVCLKTYFTIFFLSFLTLSLCHSIGEWCRTW